MNYTVIYSEYMEYEEEIEASSIAEAKQKFEEIVQAGSCEPTAARVTVYKVEPVV